MSDQAKRPEDMTIEERLNSLCVLLGSDCMLRYYHHEHRVPHNPEEDDDDWAWLLDKMTELEYSWHLGRGLMEYTIHFYKFHNQRLIGYPAITHENRRTATVIAALNALMAEREKTVC